MVKLLLSVENPSLIVITKKKSYREGALLEVCSVLNKKSKKKHEVIVFCEFTVRQTNKALRVEILCLAGFMIDLNVMRIAQ